MLILLFVGIFLLLMLFSVPIAFSLGLATIVVFIIPDVPLDLLTARMYGGLNRFIFVAIPFFILAGELMTESGILIRLMDFTRLVVGRIKGGLFHMNILVSMIFGGINGSAIADTALVGSMLIPATSREYKDRDFTAAVTACSSVVGPVIPPSLPMLLYAFVAGNVSVGALFMAGVVPGIILAGGLMLITAFVIRKKDLPKLEYTYSFMDILKIVSRFSVTIMLPVIMVGGIVSGVFTPTESGCVAVFYALFVGFFITRELTFKKVYGALVRTTVVSGVVLFIISISCVTTWWLTIQRVPDQIIFFLESFITGKQMFLLVIVALLLFIGLFVEVGAGIILLVPILVPLSESYGVNPIQFGLMTCLGLLIGVVTPPVGICLYLSSSIAETRPEKVFKAALPLLALEGAVLLLITFFPQTYLWVPKLFGYSTG